MKRFILYTICLINIIVFTSLNTTNAQTTRTITIAGLVVDVSNLSPIPSAQLFDNEHHLVGSTDERGYYKIAIKYAGDGPIHFSVIVKKQGFESFTQTENWGDIAGNSKQLMYFCLHKPQDTIRPANSFSYPADCDLSYANVLEKFGKVKDQLAFNDKLEKAEYGNEDVFIVVDKQPFIVDNTGWIKIGSAKDLVLINNKTTVAADQLNQLIKRKDVESMTPVQSATAKFAITTK